MSSEPLQKLVAFAKCYDVAHLQIYRRHVHLTEDNNAIRNNAYAAAIFFTMYAHERQNAGSNYGAKHRLALIRSIPEGSSFERELLSDGDFPNQVWAKFKELANFEGTESRGASYAVGPVKEFLVQLSEKKESNWFNVAHKMTPEKAFEWLDDLSGIGEKISSFIIRDSFSILNLWDRIPDEQMYCTQPIDRWVRNWWEILPGEGFGKQISEDEGPKTEQMKKLTKTCLDRNVDPIAFNKAAWFIGAHFEDICDYFDVDWKKRTDRVSCLFDIDEKKLETAILDYSKLSKAKQVFAV